ncbi:MAG: hypothetical protein ACT4R6_04015 [Gemmatimonadaceae bacterium]
MSATLQTVLQRLAHSAGVRAAVLAVEDDGVSVQVAAHADVDTDALAALGCRVFRAARLANDRAGFGRTGVLRLEAQHGQVFVAGPSGLLVIVLAERDANAGALRLSVAQAADQAGALA